MMVELRRGEQHWSSMTTGSMHLHLLMCPGHLQALYGGWPESGKQESPARYGPKAARWVAVSQEELLGAVLSSEDYIIPGLPAFFIVPAESHIEKQLLSNELPIL